MSLDSLDPTSAKGYPLDRIAAHIEEERRNVSLLGEVREIVFGAQDGLVSTLAVVATVSGATNDNLAILIAGLAAAVAGIFSMAIGEYMGSKSQSEIFAFQVQDEVEEIQERPFEAEAEVAWLFMEDGMTEADAWHTAAVIARHPRALLTTMVSRELGIIPDEQDETSGSPLRGALFMGASFAAGAAVPVLPFMFTRGTSALVTAVVATGLTLFVMGAVKARWTGRSWLWSGLEILSLAALAGVVGYFLGTMMPSLLGFAA